MNKIVTKVDEIIEIIKSSDEYLKYIELKNRMIEDKEIMNLINKIKEMQKKIINETYKGNEVSDVEENINEILSVLNNYPIYVEFNYIQKDLNEQFQYIKNVIEKKINI